MQRCMACLELDKAHGSSRAFDKQQTPECHFCQVLLFLRNILAKSAVSVGLFKVADARSSHGIMYQ